MIINFFSIQLELPLALSYPVTMNPSLTTRFERFLDSLSPVERYIKITVFAIRMAVLYPYARYRWKRLPFRELTILQQMSVAQFHGNDVYGPLSDDRRQAEHEAAVRLGAERRTRERTKAPVRHRA